MTRSYDQGAVATDIGRLTIGHFNPATRPGATDRMFRGLIDGIQVHGDVLTLEQVKLVQRLPTLAIAGAATTEGNSGSKQLSFTVMRNGDLSSPSSVNWATSNGTATAGSDYLAASGTVQFIAGQSTATLNVTILGDTTVEPDETFTVTLSGATGATITAAVATGTILNDDTAANQPPVVNDQAFSIAENSNNGTTVGTVVASDPDAGQSLTYAITAGNTNNAFAINAATGQITVANSSVLNYEATPSFGLTVQVTDNGSPALSDTATITVNLTNVNESPTDLTLSSSSVAENQPSDTTIGTFSTDDPDADNTFTYSLVSGTGSTDNASFTIQGNILKTAASFDYETKSSYSIRVRSTDQGGLWTEKVFTIGVTNVNEAPTASPISKSLNEDTTLTFAAADFTNAFSDPDAGNTLQKIQVVTLPSQGTLRLGGVAVTLNQEIATAQLANLTYTPPADWNGGTSFTYKASDGTLWSAATGTATLTVNPVNDAPGFTKGADQSVTVNAGPQSIANWATNLSKGPANESSQTLIFEITGNTNAALFSAQPQVSPTGTLTYTPAAGATGTATITLRIKDNGDTANGGVDVSPTQTFVIAVTPLVTVPILRIQDASVIEGDSGTKLVGLTVLREGDTTGVSAVSWATAPGTALAGSDYVAASGVLAFEANELSKFIEVAVVGDVAVENNEVFYINLSDPINAQINDGQGIVTIIDNDGPVLPELNIGNASIAEGDSGTKILTFTVYRAGGTSGTSSATFSTGGGTATAGDDYVSRTGTVSFAAGAKTATIEITLNGDKIIEPDETFNITLSNPIGAKLARETAVGTIVNDDAAPLENVTITAVKNKVVVLDWEDTAIPNFSYYNVYRGTTADFTPSGSNRIAQWLLESEYRDTTPTGGETYYYKVTTVDQDGDESPASFSSGQGTTTPDLKTDHYWYEDDFPGPYANESITLAVDGLAPHRAVTLVLSEYYGGSLWYNFWPDSVSDADLLQIRADGQVIYQIGPDPIIEYWEDENGELQPYPVGYDTTIGEGAWITYGSYGTYLTFFHSDESLSFEISGQYLDSGVYEYGGQQYPWAEEWGINNYLRMSVVAPNVSIAVVDATASENGDDFAEFTISRSGDPRHPQGPVNAHPLTVNFELVDKAGYAVQDEDYELELVGPDESTSPLSGTTVEIPSGASSITIRVKPIDDDLLEGREWIGIRIDDGEDYTHGDGLVFITILDNDKPDLDADSDNTDKSGRPAFSEEEEDVEEGPEGKWIAVAKEPGKGKFVPLVVDLSKTERLDGATVSFNVRDNVKAFRIWTISEGTGRPSDALPVEDTGKVITLGHPYSAEELGLTAGTKTTFYVEAVSSGIGDIDFSITCPNPRPGYPSYSASDSVRFNSLAPRGDASCSSSTNRPDGTSSRVESDVSGSLLSPTRSGQSNGAIMNAAEGAELRLCGNAVAIVEGETIRIYDYPGLTPRIEGQGELRDLGGGFEETLPDGTRRFYALRAGGGGMADLSWTADAHGNKEHREYAGGRITRIYKTVGDYTEAAYYAYGDNGLVSQIAIKGKRGTGAEHLIRYADYAYYAADEDHGNAGNLKSVTVYEADGTVIDRKYYRYYKSEEENGFANAVKMVFGREAYSRLLGAGLGESSSDEQVAAYADNTYLYDASGRISQIVSAGSGCSAVSCGQGTTTYTYQVNSDAAGYNTWKYRQTATFSDGASQIIYANFANQPMLEIKSDGYDWRGTYFRYDDNGQVILKANPSAVGDYRNVPDLMNITETSPTDITSPYLHDHAGLIEITEYYQAGDTSPGAAAGYVKRHSLRKGDSGVLVPQVEYTYETHTVGNVKQVVVKTQKVFRDEAGADAITTTYDYTWHEDTTPLDPSDDKAQVLARTARKSSATADQNGPGVELAETNVYDTFGRMTWSRDAAGYIQRYVFDDNGSIIESVIDVNTTLTTDEPAGWITPAGGGSHLSTQYEVDELGRTIKRTDPNGNVTWTVYNDAAQEVRTYRGWTGSGTTGPIELTREDQARGYSEFLTYQVDLSGIPGAVLNGRPTGAEQIAGLLSLERAYYNESGQMIASDRYFDVSMGYSPAGQYDPATQTVVGAPGQKDVNYHRTIYGYNRRGWLKRMVDSEDTITRTLYDRFGRVTETWVGTDDLDDNPADGTVRWEDNPGHGEFNLVRTQSLHYDNWGAGDGNLTDVYTYVDSGTTRYTTYVYDWRNRLVASNAGTTGGGYQNRVTTYSELNNLGQETARYTYTGPANAGQNVTPVKPDAQYLRSLTRTDYDDLGRVWRTSVFGINPDSGGDPTAGKTPAQIDALAALRSHAWYDKRGNVIKTSQPDGLVTKMRYDGAGRLTKTFATDGGGDSAWIDATNVDGDIVLEQAEYAYDKNSNVTLVTSRQRFHDATGTGELGTPAGSQPKARVSYAASYYDALNRRVADVNVGTNGGVAWTRPGSVPARSDTALVTSYTYDDAGLLWKVHDPRNIETRMFYDALGRTTATIEAYVDGVPSDDDDRITRYTYDGNDNVTSLTADLPAGQNDQTTVYTYGVTTAGGSNINHNGLLAGVTYPSDSNPNTSETEIFTYNRLGEMTGKTDRNGTVHSYGYDPLGRLVSDTVTTLGSGVDGAIRRLGYTYNSQGQPEKSTSYANTAGTNVVNEVLRGYNGFGQLIAEYQSHDGAVNTGSTPRVQYTYAGADEGARPTGMVYPDGRVLNYSYGTTGGLNDRISRLDALIDNDGTTTLEGFSYLGLSTVVERTHGNGTKLTYIKQGAEPNGEAGDQYAGLDRFGRIVNQRWTNTAGTVDLDRYTYTYDRNSNRTAKNNSLNANLNEAYTYDALNRLSSFTRADGREQNWNLDALGNWQSITTDGTPETRTHNDQNQITSGGLTYDANGNMTTDQEGRTLIYDAWNRLVEVKDGSTTLQRYEHDALTRRIEADGVKFFHSVQWQVLEERDATTGAVTTQYVYSPIYVDAILLRDKDTNDDGTLDQRLYYQQDANFNVTSVTDDSGNVVQRFVYDPYGVKTTLNADWSLASTDAYGILEGHQGGRYDLATGLYHFRFRDFNAELGRWVSQDPLGYVDGFNQYEYVGGAPIRYVDPLGLWRWEGGKRQGQSRAIMIAEDGDTIASAAVFVQLEPSESSKWLKDKDGNWVGQDTPIEKGCHYTVPNIVYVTSGNMTTKKNRKMNWKSGFPLLLNAAVKSRTEEYVRDMQARGYMVVEKQDVSRADVSEFVRDQDIQGWFFIGHGDKGNGRLIVEPDERWMRPDALVKHQHHKLGFVTLFACYAGRNVDDAKGGEGAGWGQLVSSNGTLRTASWNVKPYWPFVDHWTQIPIVAE